MTVLVTGAAGFIGYFTTLALLDAGQRVIGIDNLNDYYDVSLKQARLDNLLGRNGFTFSQTDIAEREAVDILFRENPDITRVIHLAAQPGVRYSLINPYAYTRSNIEGHLVLLEASRRLSGLEHFVYASSSSVYGDSDDVPFSIDKRTDTPVSLYAATKKSMEMMSHAYAHLYRMPLTGLRFFTVYGPWGRPDMAYYIFTKKILAGEPIPVFNNGEMRRDFTYIDDIVSGVLGCLDRPPADQGLPPYRLYNIGNNKTESLMDFISMIEKALGKKAEIDFQPMQAGDVKETFADIDATVEDFGFAPSTGIDVGIPRFVEWYKEFHGV
ncbi:MAG: NAD-dependent epimerase/dehydratase family protein [Rhodospirillaceae bacterium]|jgi:UDP-glucuronate 4-epimerase|nr:NAD-dependent epimerase/dehydratase family protein [Rhodospirillaceae bacterium]MBT5245062.1 NAD-dependent epimerase/dehydratase family protein [Rhodospirillaceae bacterium]MBT5561445.1 NAD-dependent epimerase/dehydratase family protein [Rhodospirillaceae bacterium]MBT6241271.1 NAD-dependent epimerase/dehydratase family protein [Rhodospirillaceae bacterium]MBT7137416.1 NAD-dependent epimerase/dehydratase family protein [Rhodospirillaceae bacterium]